MAISNDRPHYFDRPTTYFEKTCRGCGVQFTVTASKKTQQFCNIECRKKNDRKPVAERFWAKVERRGADECWPWLGLLNRAGYGKFQFATNKPRLAHRVALHLESGVDLDADYVVLHRCDNPRCVNPKHLSIGTHADNVKDMALKGRAWWTKR